jgi:sugar phosphate permease
LLQLGKVFSAMLFGYALFQTVGGLADRFGPRRVLAGGVAWWGIFTALTAMVPANIAGAIYVFVAVRFLLGAGEAVIYPSANQFIERWIPTAERGIAHGWIFAGVGAGAGLTPLLIISESKKSGKGSPLNLTRHRLDHFRKYYLPAQTQTIGKQEFKHSQSESSQLSDESLGCAKTLQNS